MTTTATNLADTLLPTVNQPGRPPKAERIQALVTLVRSNPGQFVGWYAGELGGTNREIEGLLRAAASQGYHVSVEEGRVAIHDAQTVSDPLAWLDRPIAGYRSSIRSLTIAILLQAVQDAQDGDREALEWFRGPTARHYCESLDLDHADMVGKLEKRGIRRVVRKPIGAGRSATDEYRRLIYDRYDEWRQLDVPLDVYAQRIGVAFTTLRAQFYKLGLTVAHTPTQGGNS